MESKPSWFYPGRLVSSMNWESFKKLSTPEKCIEITKYAICLELWKNTWSHMFRMIWGSQDHIKQIRREDGKVEEAWYEHGYDWGPLYVVCMYGNKHGKQASMIICIVSIIICMFNMHGILCIVNMIESMTDIQYWDSWEKKLMLTLQLCIYLMFDL